MQRTALVFAASFVVLLASAAHATPWATGPLNPPDAGQFACGVANISTTKTVEYTLTIFNSSGGTIVGPSNSTMLPGRNTRWETSSPGVQAHCVVDVTKGGRKNLRVTGMALNSSHEVVAGVPAQ